MDPREWDKRLNRLMAVMEQLVNASRQQPVINVNVNMGNGENESDPADEGEDAAELSASKRRAVSSSTSNDVPRPGGMPRPYVS